MLKVYLTDLAAYNHGYLIGKWITLPLEEEVLAKEIQKVLIVGSNAIGENTEEWFITDYEWEQVTLVEIDEYEDIYSMNKSLQMLENSSEQELKAIGFLVSQSITHKLDDAVQKLENIVVHEDQTMDDVAYNLMDELYGIDYKLPSMIANHINYEGIGRDLEIEGRYTVVGNDVYEYVE